MSTVKEEKQNRPVLSYDQRIPTLFVDGATTARRSDSTLFVSFAILLPENNVQEQCRLVMPEKAARKVVDVMCSQLDYYPVRSSETKPNSG